ncbi:PspC domain-containing protein [Amycolatopsis aidingensis]|uniref:PspC domain-containing protein n=1 Tax=Amycolatopsis aidingensis TaxID=2842453 RepID=UPI001E304FA3|nr:PspC domain-containing protein [Amycolatopsis aidingensis]
MSGATATNASGPSAGGFEYTVKDFWASRPRRPHRGRKVAGVAAAVGNRYGVDPVVVRVALVTATVFGGSGLLLYLLGWLFFPDESDEVGAAEGLIGRGRSSTSKALSLALCVAVFLSASWALTGTGWLDGGGLIGLALLVAAVYLLHRSRGHLRRPVAIPGYQEGPGGTAFAVPLSAQATAPGWDPLGAAPLAWDLPDPNPEPPRQAEPAEPPEPRRRQSRIGVATFGLAVIVGAVGATLTASDVGWFSPAHVIGLMLGVIGIGMVTGAFVHGGRGLIWLALPLSLAGLLLTSLPNDPFRDGFGPVNATPTTAAAVLPEYRTSVGTIDLDLRQLPADAEVRTRVVTGAGTGTVYVPADADVTYTCATTAGAANCLGNERSGLDSGPVTGTDFGADGGPGGAKITLDVSSSMGTAEVLRG